MKIKNIITKRNIIDEHCYHLVKEWEDALVEAWGVRLVDDNNHRNGRIYTISPKLANVLTPHCNSFVFDMNEKEYKGHNKKNIIPYIIDFFTKKDDLDLFFKHYSNHKIVIVSSKEVYDFLLEHNCPFKIAHCALSISDEYKINENTEFEKTYDFVLAGRPNKVLQIYLDEYIKKHNCNNYIIRKKEGKEFVYYHSDGTRLGVLNRKDYVKMLRQSKILFYSTPGIDGGETRTNGFNQVTPRFLEAIASGCHILARYPKNSDTGWYGIESICKNIEDYQQFETEMDFALSHKVDMKKYSEFLANHYTSIRIKQLEEIIKEF